MKWKIEYENDTSWDDESFWEWWMVTDGDKYFKCEDKGDAEWLFNILNGKNKTNGPR